MTRKAYLLYLIPIWLFLAACSSTKSIPEGGQLFTGVENINYNANKKDSHFPRPRRK